MKCFHCKGDMVKANTPYSVNRKGYHIAWDAVPAWVCTQCGEPFFEPEAISCIQQALQEIDRGTRMLSTKIA